MTPSPTSTPFLSGDSMRQDSSMSDPASNPSFSEHQDTHLVWAVTDIHDVPKGSIIINPQVNVLEMLSSVSGDFNKML